jgi:glutamyl-tRNA synthetase
MDWGNAFVASKSTNPNGEITHIDLNLHLEGDFKKTSKKVTWLSASTPENPLIPVTLIEYDYLITKKKMEEDDTLDDITNKRTEERVKALASAEVAGLKKWDIIQFERKGFYICQGTKDTEGRMEFGFIPELVSLDIQLEIEELMASPQWSIANCHAQS